MPIPQFKYKYRTAGSWRESHSYGSVNKNRLNLNLHSRPQNKKSRAGKIMKKVTFLAMIFIIFVIIGGFSLIIWLSYGLPDPNRLIDREVAQSTKIYDREGKTVLYEIAGDQKRTLVNLNDIPKYVKEATIAIEDKDFYKHGAISLWGIFRGVVIRVLSGKSPQGGSTLTQQFVKNAILTPERSITRKLKEWIVSYRLEKSYTKDQVLQMYFNEIPYGSTAYGVEAASQHYFGKSVKDVSLAEAAILAALPQAPTKYSPYGSNKELLIGRQHYILDLMVQQGYITADEAEKAKNTELKFNKEVTNIIAPHFVMYVKEILSEKYGEKTVEQGGLKIITTLDLYKQNIAEEVIKNRTPDNEKNYNATNAALISIDPKTGQVLAMVGSRDYFNEEIDGQVNVTDSPRQPGSSLKPLVYSAAFLKGYTPNTVLYDVVTNFSTDPAKKYEPHNYDSKEHGPVTMRKALAGSLNIPAVKTIYLAGIDNVLDLAQNLGYTTLNDRSRFGLSLVLGGGEVKLIEHVNAYSAFAREGFISPISVLLKVEDAKGNVLEEFNPQSNQVLDPKVARMINDILSDNDARSYIFGAKNWLTLPNRPVAAKTGTTNDYHDAWTIGFTPSIVTGVWVGNSDNKEMKRGADGSVVAAPIWHDFMNRVLGDTPVEAFKKPEIPITGKPVLDGQISITKTIKIDSVTGLLATEFTPPELIIEKIFIDQPHCLLYYIDKNNPLGDPPSDPPTDPQFNLWENAVHSWAEKIKASSTPDTNYELPPTEYDNLHLPENVPTISVLTPSPNETITTPFLSVSANASAKRGISKVEYYINDNLLSTVTSFPYNLERDISFLNNGFHNLRVRACDDVGNCQAKNLEFNFHLENNTNNNDINLSLISPSTSGLALSNIDFPFTVRLNNNNPTVTGKINLYYLTATGETKLISTVQPVLTSIVDIVWSTPPPSGTYKIYAEAIGWGGQIVKTPPLVLTINNINQQ